MDLVYCFLEYQVEVREDAEQQSKLQETLDLLVAAGYFRARIKGLSPFDKVRKYSLKPVLSTVFFTKAHYSLKFNFRLLVGLCGVLRCATLT